MTPSAVTTRADYGLDAPGVVRTMATIGAVLIAASAVLQLYPAVGAASASIGQTLLWPGASFALSALLMIASSRVGKLRARDRLLDRLDLQGTETILDVGCGHGLMLIGAARRIPAGHAIGIDLWSQTDQQSNSAENTLANARTEGVAERVTVQDGDMRQLPFEAATMDVVVSSLAIHNVPTAADRAQSIREIARVIKPGGRVALLDIAHVHAYARELRDAGWTIERLGFCPWIFPPTRELVARKPA